MLLDPWEDRVLTLRPKISMTTIDPTEIKEGSMAIVVTPALGFG
jgi:hypothetical protein